MSNEWVMLDGTVDIDLDQVYETMDPKGMHGVMKGMQLAGSKGWGYMVRMPVYEVGVKEIDPGEGYRLLGKDEEKQEGDECKWPDENEWRLVVKGHKVLGMVYRRQVKPETKALTETVASGVSQIPYSGLEAIGSVFVEGLKYGRDNWKKGVNDKGYQEQRCEHAIRHLQLWANGDRQENHLAKVAWFCVAQIELERLENE